MIAGFFAFCVRLILCLVKDFDDVVVKEQPLFEPGAEVQRQLLATALCLGLGGRHRLFNGVRDGFLCAFFDAFADLVAKSFAGGLALALGLLQLITDDLRDLLCAFSRSLRDSIADLLAGLLCLSGTLL